MRTFVLIYAVLSVLAAFGQKHVVCGYAAHSVADSINPQYVNRIIYSHMSVDTTLTKVNLKNSDRLRYIADLRSLKPELEVMVSFGGAPGLVSQSLRSDSLRALLVADIVRVVNEFGLNGVDIDWEFPGRGKGALSEKEDVANYVRLLKDLRNVLGKEKILTIACAGSGYGVDFTAMSEVLDHFNIMCYDMGTPPSSHHSALYKSDRVGWICADEAVTKFIDGGVPPSKIILGMPFYGRGSEDMADFTEWRNMTLAPDAVEQYDSIAQVPWISDAEGNMIFTYDNPYSLKIKCDYIKDRNLAGAMYWRIEQDDSDQTLGRTVYESLNSR